ncbi:MAG: TlpA family protein disulfide reductase [Myxococcales bacterium]|nr:TlpA family protein disulfide reductase [Myxococcales bacterium]
MRRFVLLRTASLAAIAAFGAACGAQDPTYVSPKETAKMIPESPAKLDYPDGPYGYVTESIVADLQFVARADSNGNGEIDPGDALKPIRLSDYYANKKIKALVVGLAAGWCGPCKKEQPELVALYKGYGGKNGPVGIIEVLSDNASPGKPADQAFADYWAKTYHLPFEVGSDPSGVLDVYNPDGAIPLSLVIRTSDMSIVEMKSGLPVPSLKKILDTIIAGK